MAMGEVPPAPGNGPPALLANNGDSEPAREQLERARLRQEDAAQEVAFFQAGLDRCTEPPDTYRSSTGAAQMRRASLAVGAAAAVLLTGCAGTAVEELPPSALESMEALAAFAREQNDGELAPVVSTPHQHKIEQDTEGLHYGTRTS